MEYRNLGRWGLKVPAISLGTWATFNEQISEETAYQCLKTAYDNGVNFFDTAEGYGDGKSEEIIGKSIKKAGWKRSDLVLSTKIFWGGNGPNDEPYYHARQGALLGNKRMERCTNFASLSYCQKRTSYSSSNGTIRISHVSPPKGRKRFFALI